MHIENIVKIFSFRNMKQKKMNKKIMKNVEATLEK